MNLGCFKPGTNGLADIRHRVYSALCSTVGGTLRLPDEPEFEYRDAVCADAGSWSSLFEDGQGEAVFTLLDPVAYGRERTEIGTAFEVDGSWPTWPTFELVALAGSAVQVGCDGAFVRVEHAFSGGEVVRTFGEQVVARVTIGTVEPVDYAQVSALVADVATLRDDVVGIDGNLTTAASVTVVENTVTTAIDDLDELGGLDF